MARYYETVYLNFVCIYKSFSQRCFAELNRCDKAWSAINVALVYISTIPDSFLNLLQVVVV